VRPHLVLVLLLIVPISALASSARACVCFNVPIANTFPLQIFAESLIEHTFDQDQHACVQEEERHPFQAYERIRFRHTNVGVGAGTGTHIAEERRGISGLFTRTRREVLLDLGAFFAKRSPDFFSHTHTAALNSCTSFYPPARSRAHPTPPVPPPNESSEHVTLLYSSDPTACA